MEKFFERKEWQNNDIVRATDANRWEEGIENNFQNIEKILDSKKIVEVNDWHELDHIILNLEVGESVKVHGAPGTLNHPPQWGAAHFVGEITRTGERSAILNLSRSDSGNWWQEETSSHRRDFRKNFSDGDWSEWYEAPLGVYVELSGQVQVSANRDCVIALCEWELTAQRKNSWSSGTLHFKNPVGNESMFAIDVWCENPLNGNPRISFTQRGGEWNTTIRPCTFTFNGVLYAGLAIFAGVQARGQVEWLGVGTHRPFGVEYNQRAHGDFGIPPLVLNEEINNSINFNNISNNLIFRINGNNVVTTSTFDIPVGEDGEPLEPTISEFQKLIEKVIALEEKLESLSEVEHEQ